MWKSSDRMHSLLKQVESLAHIFASEARSDRAASHNGDELVVVPSAAVAGHPVAPFLSIHSPDFTTGAKVFQLYILDVLEGNRFAAAERKVVAFYNHLPLRNNHIFVLVQNSTHMIIKCKEWYILLQTKCYKLGRRSRIRFDL